MLDLLTIDIYTNDKANSVSLSVALSETPLTLSHTKNLFPYLLYIDTLSLFVIKMIPGLKICPPKYLLVSEANF